MSPTTSAGIADVGVAGDAAASLLDGVKPGMACYDDEIFGPVLSVVRARTYDEAVGMIAEMLQSFEAESTPLQKKLEHLGKIARLFSRSDGRHI